MKITMKFSKLFDEYLNTMIVLAVVILGVVIMFSIVTPADSDSKSSNFVRNTTELVASAPVDYRCTASNGRKYKLFDYNDSFMYAPVNSTNSNDYVHSETLRGAEHDKMYNARISESGNSSAGLMSNQMFKHNGINFLCKRV
ncbi:hypothetical protein [Klebsiella aerogenes]|uniref:hypothetical protein n=1 Tax=Klebsiella aerogenes TaxID=548 RepID=UPI0022799F50|nr:hypothetical protein [Klebsiella aerogenes]MCY4762696.1 hypothetical protein [Klebsiella aerogenes]